MMKKIKEKLSIFGAHFFLNIVKILKTALDREINERQSLLENNILSD